MIDQNPDGTSGVLQTYSILKYNCGVMEAPDSPFKVNYSSKTLLAFVTVGDLIS